ncbi:hypothetical protein ACFL3G_12355, partial [Planctomycetota bacterium]
QIQWSVKKVTPAKCNVDVVFDFPVLLKFRLYIAIIVLATIFYVADSTLKWSIDVGSSYGFYTIILIRLTAWSFFVTPFLLAGSLLCTIAVLLKRYRLFIEQILQEVSIKSNKNIYNAWKKIAGSYRVLIGKNFFFATFIISVCVAVVPNKDVYGAELLSNNINLILVVLIALICLIACRKIKRYYENIKVFPAIFNCLFTFTIIFFLSGAICLTKTSLQAVSAEIQNFHTTSVKTTDSNLLGESSEDIATKDHRITVWIVFCFVISFTLHIVYWSALFCVFLLFSRVLDNFIQGPVSIHCKALEEVFNKDIRTKKDKSYISLQLPLIVKIAIGTIFFILSVTCWGLVLINFSMINTLIAPGFQIINFSSSETIATTAKTLAQSLLRNTEIPWLICLLSIILLLPSIVPSFLFVYLNFRALFNSLKESCITIPCDNIVVKKTKLIASRMGVSKVKCLLNSQSNIISPYAEIRGWPPRNKIVFTHHSLKFLEDHSAEAEAIIAHEIAHLKYDCKTIWRLGILSRIGLVGSGFVSVLYDSIAMEDRADNASRKYLRENGLNENLLTEAAFMLETQNYINTMPNKPQPYAVTFESRYTNKNTMNLQKQSPLSKKIVWALHIIYDFYFKLEFYEYLHREAKYRRAMREMP